MVWDEFYRVGTSPLKRHKKKTCLLQIRIKPAENGFMEAEYYALRRKNGHLHHHLNDWIPGFLAHTIHVWYTYISLLVLWEM